MSNLLTRLTALFLVPSLVADPITAAAFAPHAEASACPIRIPARYGTITDSFSARDLGFGLRGSGFASKKDYSSNTNPETRIPKPVVVLIQDLHGNVGVQRNIAEIIKYLATQQLPLQAPGSRLHGLFRAYSLEPRAPLTVFLEGAFGPFNVSLVRNIRNGRVKNQIVEKYLGAALLTGTEVAAMESPHPLHLWGVDDKALYLRNLQAFSAASFKNSVPHPKHKAWNVYYNLAEQRNVPLALNALTHLELLSRTAITPKVAALVVGGYHTAGITKILKANQVSYVVVTPNAPSLGEERSYVNRMRWWAEATRKRTLALLAICALCWFSLPEVHLIQTAIAADISQKTPTPSSLGSIVPIAWLLAHIRFAWKWVNTRLGHRKNPSYESQVEAMLRSVVQQEPLDKEFTILQSALLAIRVPIKSIDEVGAGSFGKPLKVQLKKPYFYASKRPPVDTLVLKGARAVVGDERTTDPKQAQIFLNISKANLAAEANALIALKETGYVPRLYEVLGGVKTALGQEWEQVDAICREHIDGMQAVEALRNGLITPDQLKQQFRSMITAFRQKGFELGDVKYDNFLVLPNKKLIMHDPAILFPTEKAQGPEWLYNYAIETLNTIFFKAGIERTAGLMESDRSRYIQHVNDLLRDYSDGKIEDEERKREDAILEFEHPEVALLWYMFYVSGDENPNPQAHLNRFETKHKAHFMEQGLWELADYYLQKTNLEQVVDSNGNKYLVSYPLRIKIRIPKETSLFEEWSPEKLTGLIVDSWAGRKYASYRPEQKIRRLIVGGILGPLMETLQHFTGPILSRSFQELFVWHPQPAYAGFPGPSARPGNVLEEVQKEFAALHSESLFLGKNNKPLLKRQQDPGKWMSLQDQVSGFSQAFAEPFKFWLPSIPFVPFMTLFSAFLVQLFHAPPLMAAVLLLSAVTPLLFPTLHSFFLHSAYNLTTMLSNADRPLAMAPKNKRPKKNLERLESEASDVQEMVQEAIRQGTVSNFLKDDSMPILSKILAIGQLGAREESKGLRKFVKVYLALQKPKRSLPSDDISLLQRVIRSFETDTFKINWTIEVKNPAQHNAARALVQRLRIDPEKVHFREPSKPGEPQNLADTPLVEFSLNKDIEVLLRRRSQNSPVRHPVFTIPEIPLKYNLDPVPTHQAVALKKALSIGSRKVIVLGSPSTEEVEEFMKAYNVLYGRLPLPKRPFIIFGFRTPITSEKMKKITGLNETEFLMRDSTTEVWPDTRSHHVLVLNTTGELRRLYAIAAACDQAVAIVGDDHNILEPAAQGLATLYFPGKWKFNGPVKDQMERSDATHPFSEGFLGELLEDKGVNRRMAGRANQFAVGYQTAVTEEVDKFALLAAAAMIVAYSPAQSASISTPPRVARMSPRRTNIDLFNERDRKWLAMERIPWKKVSKEAQSWLILELFRLVSAKNSKILSVQELTYEHFNQETIPALGNRLLIGLYDLYRRHPQRKDRAIVPFMLNEIGLIKLVKARGPSRTVQQLLSRIKGGDQTGYAADPGNGVHAILREGSGIQFLIASRWWARAYEWTGNNKYFKWLAGPVGVVLGPFMEMLVDFAWPVFKALWRYLTGATPPQGPPFSRLAERIGRQFAEAHLQSGKFFLGKSTQPQIIPSKTPFLHLPSWWGRMEFGVGIRSIVAPILTFPHQGGRDFWKENKQLRETLRQEFARAGRYYAQPFQVVLESTFARVTNPLKRLGLYMALSLRMAVAAFRSFWRHMQENRLARKQGLPLKMAPWPNKPSHTENQIEESRIKKLEQQIRQFPESIPPYLALAEHYARKGHWKEAKEYVTNALWQTPAPTERAELIREYLRLARVIRKCSDELMSAGYCLAKEEVRHHPTDPDVRFLWIRTLDESGRHEEALEENGRLMKDFANAPHIIARALPLLIKNSSVSECEKTWVFKNYLLKEYPNDAFLAIRFSELASRIEDHESAVALAEKAYRHYKETETNSDYDLLHAVSTYIKALRYQGEIKKALKIAEETIRSGKGDKAIWTQKATLLFQLKGEKAIRSLEDKKEELKAKGIWDATMAKTLAQFYVHAALEGKEGRSNKSMELLKAAELDRRWQLILPPTKYPYFDPELDVREKMKIKAGDKTFFFTKRFLENLRLRRADGVENYAARSYHGKVNCFPLGLTESQKSALIRGAVDAWKPNTLGDYLVGYHPYMRIWEVPSSLAAETQINLVRLEAIPGNENEYDLIDFVPIAGPGVTARGGRLIDAKELEIHGSPLGIWNLHHRRPFALYNDVWQQTIQQTDLHPIFPQGLQGALALIEMAELYAMAREERPDVRWYRYEVDPALRATLETPVIAVEFMADSYSPRIKQIRFISEEPRTRIVSGQTSKTTRSQGPRSCCKVIGSGTSLGSPFKINCM